jgi:O-antigen/teichoic acid export membrane protein
LNDLGGKGRFARNVAFAWIGFFAQAVSGFVMPRVISDSLGQVGLGTWDLAWSLVTYLGIIELGLSSSVNRFVAKHRAQGDSSSLSQSVSTVSVFLKVAGAVAAVLTVIGSLWFLPACFSRLGSELHTTQLVVLLLGAEVAVSLTLAVNIGIIVGCLKSDLHYSVSTLAYGLSAAGMIGALLMGGGLPAIALVHFAVTASADVARWRLARRLCPDVVVSFSNASWATWREQSRFTAKSTIPAVAEMISNQSVSLLVAATLGPAALAVFSRPRNLIRQLRTLVARFGYILIPAASSLHAQAQNEELATAVREKTQQIALLTMPLAVTLAIVGNDVIGVWMGQSYVHAAVVPILAIGALPTWIQEPGWSILTGMNRHGGVAVAKLIGSILTAVTVAIGLSVFHWNLSSTAVGLVIPMFVVDAVVVPVFVCRAFGFRLGDYCWNAWLRPAMCVAPYAALLLLLRNALGGGMTSLAVSLATSAMLLIATYWAVAGPPAIRSKVLRGDAA